VFDETGSIAMRSRLLIGSLVLNVVLAGLLVTSVALAGKVGTNFVESAAERWRTRFELYAGQKGGIVFLGDSITEESHWSELFGDCRIRNRGIGGDTTRNLLDRVDQVYALEPGKIFLMVGVNDLNTGVPQEETLANYRSLFDGFAQRLPLTRIYVQSVLPVGEDWMGGASNGGIARLNAALAAESVRRGYTWIDLNGRFRDEHGALRAGLSNDGIHLMGEGYRIWRDAVVDLVRE
jgi:lysophospholipase L1-like esterase